MKRILAFGASNSRKSINQQLATWAANQLADVTIDLIDLNDYDMPLYSIDREQEGGIPEEAKRFKEKIHAADGILISFAEHNSCYTAAFKNLFDWTSRIEASTWSEKPMFLMATSPGGRGGQTVLGIVTSAFPFRGGKVAANFSLPFFGKNFSETDGIMDEALLSDFRKQLGAFEGAL